jgi:hypothetical protein
MRLSRNIGAALAIFAATACSSITVKPESSSARPAPAPRQNASTAATLGIPPGHLPPPGKCKVWIPGTPPGHQARARSCNGIEGVAPAGSWILYRPTEDRKVVHVRVIDGHRAGVIVRRRVYDAERGTLVREGR